MMPGVSIGNGKGTNLDRCSAMSNSVRLRYEIVGPAVPEDDGMLVLSWHVGSRWLVTWEYPAEEVVSGALDEILADPVMICLEGWVRPNGDLFAWYLGFAYLLPEVRFLELGGEVRPREHRKYPGDPARETADILLGRLFGRPQEEVEKLLRSLG